MHMCFSKKVKIPFRASNLPKAKEFHAVLQQLQLLLITIARQDSLEESQGSLSRSGQQVLFNLEHLLACIVKLA